jgi:hypothetical protein
MPLTLVSLYTVSFSLGKTKTGREHPVWIYGRLHHSLDLD